MEIKKKDLLHLLRVIGLNMKTGYEKYLGKDVFIRGVTNHYTGHVIEVNSMTLEIEKAAWIADDGKFSEAMADSSKFNEVEVYNKPVSVSLYAIEDITVLTGALPRETK